MSEIIWTKDQKNALNVFSKFIHSNEPYMILSGYAGTGKTTLVNEILANYLGDVVITAPTHKALSVLRSKTDSCHYDDSRTIHSLLSLKLKKKNHKEVLFRDFDAEPKMPESGLIILDECSMVGQKLFDYLDEQMNDNIKVLFVGDILQLPPVEESLSPTFGVPELKAELKEVVRQAMDNPIINMTVKIREAIRAKNEDIIDFKTNTTDDNLGIVVYSKAKKFKEAVFNVVDHTTNIDNGYKVISWRNKVVNNFNDTIRNHVYNGEPDEDFLVNEKVIINDSIMQGSDIIPRDSEGIIHQMEKVKIDKFNMITREDLHGYKLNIYIPLTGTYISVIALDSVSKRTYDTTLRNLSSNKNWTTFWKIKEEFKDIRHIHSITSHKSQGSTYVQAFIDADDILSNPDKEEALKCFYVAVSRASETAHILYR